MSTPQGYVLLLGASGEESGPVYHLLLQHQYSVFIASSTAQAVARIAESSPCLMILLGNRQHWSPTVVKHLRQQVQSTEVTIVALTELSGTSWSPREDYADLDGFFVTPISDDVLTSVLESALVKTGFCP